MIIYTYNNSSDWIVQGIFNRFAPKSDKEKKGNSTVKEEEEVLKTESLGNTTPIDNIKIKLNLIKASEDDGKSEVSTAAVTSRNNIKMRESAINAPKKQLFDNKSEASTFREYNTPLFSKFRKLGQEKTEVTKSTSKTFIISFNDNGDCEIRTDYRKYTIKKTLKLEYGGYVVYSKMPENNNGSDFQYLHGSCSALEKRKDDSNTNFERGENDKELDLGERIISLEKLFENSDIDEI